MYVVVRTPVKAGFATVTRFPNRVREIEHHCYRTHHLDARHVRYEGGAVCITAKVVPRHTNATESFIIHEPSDRQIVVHKSAVATYRVVMQSGIDESSRVHSEKRTQQVVPGTR